MNKHAVEYCREVVVDLNENKPIRVLLVDDELDLLKVAKQCLELQGLFQVDTASSAEEALAKLEKKQYDTVVSDYQMPGKDGLELLKQLRKEDHDIAFIILTGKGREDVAIEALNLGADRYLNKAGDPRTVYCELAYAIRQAADRRSIRIELLKREAKLNAILESSPEAITITDLDGNIIECNQATTDLHRCQSKEQLIGRSALELVAKKDREKAIQNLKKTIEQGSVKLVEYTLLTEDGREFPGELSASVVRDASGKPEYFVGISRDITERNWAKKTLQESEEKYRRLVENLHEGIWAIDKDSFTTFANSRMAEILGYTVDEMLGKPLFAFMDERGIEIAKRLLDRRAQGIREQHDFEFVRKEGSRIYATLETSPINDSNGDYIGALAGVMDTTERRKTEDALRESEEKFKGLVESTSDWIWQTDKKGIYIYASPKIKDILGYEPEEVVGKTRYDLMPEDKAKITAKLLGEIAKKKESFHGIENWNVHKNGTAVLLETGGTPIFDQEGDLVGYRGIDRDITQRREAEAELRRLATIVTDSNDAVTVVDLDGRITAWNKGAETTYGYRKDEALGMDVFDIVPDDKKQETLDVIGKIRMNETVGSFETKRLAKNGCVLDVWLTVTKLVDDEGNAVALATTERDITEKKRLEEKLRSSEKFTVLGQLSSSVAHEIRNPLGVIKNSVYFLNIRLKEHADEKVRKHLRIMEDNVSSADRIISDLLDVARNKVGDLESVGLNRILDRAFASLSVPENIKVVAKLDKIPKMLLDPERIQRVFVNMIQNAVAAMPKGGKLTVEVSRSGDSVEISFKDSGVGIPEENMQKLFTPLFTTKAKGLGLGLAICKQIVEGHHGDIVVKSKAGEGALFIVRLPILSGTELVKTELLQADMLTGGMNK